MKRSQKFSWKQNKIAILYAADSTRILCNQIAANLNLRTSRWLENEVLIFPETMLYDKKLKSLNLTSEHKIKRLFWAKNYMTWNNEWKKVVWSDEKN